MDKVLADTLTANLKSAKTQDERNNAFTLAMIAMVDCQCKTAGRVKELHEDRERRIWLGRLVSGFAAAGGFTLLVKALKVWGMM